MNNIEIISYTATTTALDGTATTTTAGQYVIPYFLFNFMLAIIIITMAVIISLLYFKNKKYGA